MLLLFVLIQTLTVISGAHFNPAVTVAMVALRRIKPSDAGIYILAQLAGGLTGAGLTRLILVDEGARENYGAPAVSGRPRRGDLGRNGGRGARDVLPGLGHRRGCGQSSGGQGLGRVCHRGGARNGRDGSGAAHRRSFNPARSLGPAIWGKAFGGVDTFVLVYVIAPLLCALAAAVLYSQVLMAPGRKEAGGAEPVG